MTVPPYMSRLIDLALEEDVGPGDLTTEALIPRGAQGQARIVAREDLVISGIGSAEAVFSRLDPETRFERYVSDGDRLSAGDTVLRVIGCLSVLLTGERTALNFIQRLSGIASLTRRYVDALAGSDTKLLDTRKTTPGWRALEKAAVRHGGGSNHRVALFDGVLIKDNHLVAAGDIEAAVRAARSRAPALVRIEVEVESIGQLREAIDAGADVVLLDNMDDALLREAVDFAGGRVLLEASGRITLDRVPALASLGLDFISCGALTHSATAVDLSLDVESPAGQPQ